MGQQRRPFYLRQAHRHSARGQAAAVRHQFLGRRERLPDRGPLPDGPASRIATEGRNDLEAPAIALVPQIAEVLDALRDGAKLARMSGSGATCFALYATEADRDAAAAALPREWWQMAGKLRP